MSKDSTRTHFTELADSNEVEKMLEKEAHRLATNNKLAVHYPDFSLVIEWLKHLSITFTLFEQQDISVDEVLKTAESIKTDVVNSSLQKLNAGDTKLKSIIESITNYLGEEDIPENSDFILVFGSGDLGRVEKAVELYNNGVAGKIVITGGQPHYQSESLPEAVVFSRHAIKLGIPKDRILIEPNSINFADNAKTVFNTLDLFNMPYKKITTVTAWFSHRRIWCHLMKLSPDNTVFYRVNTVIDTGRLSKSEWFTNELGVSVVFNEFVKMKIPIILNNTA